jgi:hypothetical protein
VQFSLRSTRLAGYFCNKTQECRRSNQRRLCAEALEDRNLLAGFPFGIGGMEGLDIASDPSGNVYISGNFENGSDFDPGANSANFDGGFVSKYSEDGEFIWARGIQQSGSGTFRSRGSSLAVDSAGNVYVSVIFAGSGTIAGISAGNIPYASNQFVSSQSDRNQLIVKFDTQGDLQWTRLLVGAGEVDQYRGGIAIGESANVLEGVYVAGRFSGTVDFDPSDTSVAILTSAGGSDIFILKLDGSGAYQWAIRGGSTGNDFGGAIAVSPNGSVYATGGFTGDNPFGEGTPLASRGGQDGFVVKVSKDDGQVTWLRGFGGTGLDAGRRIEAADSYVAVAGNFDTVTGGAEFGSQTLHAKGSLDAFASKLDSSGNFLWTRPFGGTGNDHGWGLALDASNNVYVGGTFYDTVDFDPGPASYQLTARGSNADPWITQLDSDGNFGWATQLAGDASDGLRGIAWIGARNSVVLTGFAGSSTLQATNHSGSVGPALIGPAVFACELQAITGLPTGSPAVFGRSIFYNNSRFDSGDQGSDDAAVAFDKKALRQGKASFANYTNYNRGINGIMVDIANPAGSITVSDFEFRIGNTDTPADWVSAPSPSQVKVSDGGGVNGSVRVTLEWEDNSIDNTWLQVTVGATSNTGLQEPDVFYIGNAIGDVGNSTSDAIVNATDIAAVVQNQNSILNPAPVNSPYDMNRDGQINATDIAIVVDNQTSLVDALRLIRINSGGAGGSGGYRYIPPADPDPDTVSKPIASVDRALFFLATDRMILHSELRIEVVGAVSRSRPSSEPRIQDGGVRSAQNQFKSLFLSMIQPLSNGIPSEVYLDSMDCGEEEATPFEVSVHDLSIGQSLLDLEL